MNLYDRIVRLDPRNMAIKYLQKVRIPYTYEYCSSRQNKFDMNAKVIFRNKVSQIKMRGIERQMEEQDESSIVRKLVEK